MFDDTSHHEIFPHNDPYWRKKEAEAMKVRVDKIRAQIDKMISAFPENGRRYGIKKSALESYRKQHGVDYVLKPNEEVIP